MAFSLCEKDNIQWVTSDVLGTKHLFSRRLGDVGDFPFSSKPDPEWESESRQERVRALWQRFRTAAEFPAEGFCFTRQVHGTVLRYVTEAELKDQTGSLFHICHACQLLMHCGVAHGHDVGIFRDGQLCDVIEHLRVDFSLPPRKSVQSQLPVMVSAASL